MTRQNLNFLNKKKKTTKTKNKKANQIAYMSLRFCMEVGEHYDQCNAIKMIEVSNKYINKINQLKSI